MNTRVRRGASALAIATLALVAAACGSDEEGTGSNGANAECPWEPDSSVETSARIAWQAIPNGDVVVKDLGLLEACLPNADISWVQASSGGDVLKYYGADEVDLGLMGSAPASRSASAPLNADLDLQVVWIHDVIGEAESLIVKNAEVTSVSDLKGTALGVPFSSTAHYSLVAALEEAGLDTTKDVELVNLEPEKMPAAWQSDEIDGVWVWNPVQSQLIADGGTRLISSADTAEAGRPTFDVGTASTAFAQANPEFLEVWAKAQDHAIDLIKNDTAAAAESVAVVLGITPDEAEQQFSELVFLTAAEQAGDDFLGQKFAQDLFATASFLAEQGEVDGVGTAEEFANHVDASFAASVGNG